MIKKYADDTFYLACSIADRYLAYVAMRVKKSPNLVQLATVSLLMAAKLY